jgi:hypothetical protein
MKSIYTLIPDIYELLTQKGWFTDAIAQEFEKEVSRRLQEQFKERAPPRLRLSKLGPVCPKALWHSIHTPDSAEPLPPWAHNKFSYGHILEAWAICLAKASGHTVTGEQDELTVDGIRGHRDCVIDGCIVDVKSCSSPTYLSLEKKTISSDDKWGYLDQLDGYLEGSSDDPLVIEKNKAFLLGIDKTLGHMVLYEHTFRKGRIPQRIKEYREYVGRSSPPDCRCEVIDAGEGGNQKLGVKASYSPHKFDCFPQLRTFLYAGGPEYFTKVVKRPYNKCGPIKEINKFGKQVYA